MGAAAPTTGPERTLVTTDGDLRRALALAGVTAPAHWHDSVGSTNAEAASWAGASAPEFALVAGFVRWFVDGYGDAGSGAGFADQVRTRWRSVSATLGREVHVTRTDGRTIRGRAVDVDERGGLVIEAEGGRITVRSGEVEHV